MRDLSLPYRCDFCSMPGYGDRECSPICDRKSETLKRGRPSTGFNKTAYMKEYMRKRRMEKRDEKRDSDKRQAAYVARDAAG